MSRSGLVIAMIAVVGACSGAPGAAAEDAAVDLPVEAPDAPGRCENPALLSSCAATYDQQVQALQAHCSTGYSVHTGACGSHLIVVGRYGCFTADACFYDHGTKALVSAEGCDDTNSACNGTASCEFAGPPVEASCEGLVACSAGTEDICPNDAGADEG